MRHIFTQTRGTQYREMFSAYDPEAMRQA
jgi:hypothetical protein